MTVLKHIYKQPWRVCFKLWSI